MSKKKQQQSRPRPRVQDADDPLAVVDKLQVHRIPDTPYTYGRRPRTRGITFDGGVTRFIAVLFEANETLPLNKKMTDPTIQQLILEEFPNTKTAEALLSGRRPVNHLRKLYNNGGLTSHIVPDKPSVRWSIDGVPVRGRGCKAIPLEDLPEHVKAQLAEKDRKVKQLVKGKRQAVKSVARKTGKSNSRNRHKGAKRGS